ncbi:MAG: type II toxin-antitoxin system VapC family toxin [Kineosporiaceae bacterium]
MTSVLMDSHVLLWALDGADRLGPQTRRLLLDPTTTAYVSAATTWELQVKRLLGKLACPVDLEQRIVDAGFSELAIRCRHTQALEAIALPHRDPFDRMLLAQAQTEGLAFLTADRILLDTALGFVRDAGR